MKPSRLVKQKSHGVPARSDETPFRPDPPEGRAVALPVRQLLSGSRAACRIQALQDDLAAFHIHLDAVALVEVSLQQAVGQGILH